MDKFRHKLPKEELKKFAKEVNKKLVASDYKNNRVDDPTSITAKQEKKVKKYVKDFLDRAVQKYTAHEKRKAERAARHEATNGMKYSESDAKVVTTETLPVHTLKEDTTEAADDVLLSDMEDSPTSLERKRKREDDVESPSATPSETPSVKRLKEDEVDAPSPPPPPPPPEAAMDEQDHSLREQEKAWARENEEAQRLAAEAEKDRIAQEEALQRENEEAMRDFELEQEQKKKLLAGVSDSNGTTNGEPFINGEGLKAASLTSRAKLDLDGADLEMAPPHSNKDGDTLKPHENEARKREVLSH
jgi:histone-lysine N-methyltransferase SETD2